MQETEFRSLPSLAQQNNFPHQQQQHPSGNSQSQQQQLHQPLSVSTSVHGGQLLPSMKTAGVRGGPGSGGGPPGSNSSTPMMMMPPQQQQQQPPQQPRSAHVSGSTPTAAIVYHSPGPIASSSAKRHSMHSIPTSSSTSQSRLSEFLDVARAEAESLLESYSICRTQKDEFEARLTQQINELSNFQQNLYELERAHTIMKQQFEDEIKRLHLELDMARKQSSQAANISSSKASSTTTAAANPDNSSSTKFTNANPAARPEIPPPNLDSSGFGVFAPITNGQQPQVSGGGATSTSAAAPSTSISADEHPSKRFKSDDYEPAPAPTATNTRSIIQPITGECNLSTESLPPTFKQQGSDWSVVLNPNSQAISESPIKLDLVQSFEHTSVVCCVKFSKCGNFLATGCNHIATVYDVRSGEKIAALGETSTTEDLADLYIRSVVFSPDGKKLATGAENKTIRVWEIESKQVVYSFLGHDQEIYSLDWSKDGKVLVSGSGDRSIKVWDLEGSGRCSVTMVNTDDKLSPADPESDTKDAGVTSVAINNLYPCCVAAGSLDRMVRVWDSRTGKLLERFEGHQDSVYSVAFSPDGRSIVSGALDQTIKVWDLSKKTLDYLSRTENSDSNIDSIEPLMTRTCRHTFAGHKDFVLSVAFAGTNGSFGRVDANGDPVATPNGDSLAEVEWVVSGSKDWSVVFWDARAAGKEGSSKGIAAQFMLQGHVNSVISVALAPNRGLFATGAGDCKARIWRVSTSDSSAPAGPSNNHSYASSAESLNKLMISSE